MSKENTYKGYPLFFEAEAVGTAKALRDRGNEITCEIFEGLGTTIEVEGIQRGKTQKLWVGFMIQSKKLKEIFGLWFQTGVQNILLSHLVRLRSAK